MRTPATWVVAIVLPLLAAGLSGCGDDSDNNPALASTPTRSATAAPTALPLTSAQVLQRGPYSVGSTTMVFEDTSRPTNPNRTFPGAPTRVLKTEIWYPTDSTPTGAQPEVRDASLAQGGRPYPLIIYSHGFTSMRTGGAYLARHLVSYGYVVAAPDFPLSNGQAPGGPNFLDLGNQPRDVSFVIDQVLALSAAPQGTLAGAIDAQRIGLTGLSMGGSTTFLATFHPTLRDQRVRAAAPMAGVACFLSKDFYGDRTVPLLIVHGDIDAVVPYAENGVFAFGEANPPKYLVTLQGGSHTGFADGIELIAESANNPDDLGCRTLGGPRGGSAAASEPSLTDLLGGPAAGIIAGDCPPGCTMARQPRSMRPSRQHQLTILSIFPFFEAELRGNQAARHFLDASLAAENLDLTLQSEH